MRRVDSLESIINKMEAGEQRSQALIKAFPDLLFVIDYSGKYLDFLAGKEKLASNAQRKLYRQICF
jgi:hypothetical protein